VSERRFATGGTRSRFGAAASDQSVVLAGIVLGLGLGGFFDGIVFHQVLQWHHMLSAHPDPGVAGDLRLNVLWDGLFHVASYLLTIAGVVLVWRAWRSTTDTPSGRALLGATIAGWGLFNLIEGAVNHFLLGIHHVWADGPGGVLVWDVAFMAWGVVFLVFGHALIRRAPADRSSMQQ